MGVAACLACLAAAISEAAKFFVESLNYPPLFTAAAAVLVAGAVAIIGIVQEPGPTSGFSRPGQPRPGSRTSGVITALVVVTVLGAAIYGGSWLFRYVTGSQSGVERLAEPGPTATAGDLRMTVTSVEDTEDFIKITVQAVNSAAFPVTIPVANSNCSLINANGGTLTPYTLASFGDSTLVVPANGIAVQRELTFKGQPKGETLTLTFSTLFWQGFNEPTTISITDILLQPAA